VNFDKFRSNKVTRIHTERVFDKYLAYNKLAQESVDLIWKLYSDGHHLN